MNKKLLVPTVITAIVAPALALAQSVGGIAQNVAGQVYVVGVAMVVIAWVVTGILFLIAYGDEGKLEKARLALYGSIGGTIIIIISTSAWNVVKSSFGV